MKAGPELAWRQLVAQKGHFSAAVAGVAFAVTLMLGQIGLRDSLLETAVRLYSQVDADLVMVSWQYQFAQGAGVIPNRRIEQAQAVAGIASCVPLQMGWLPLENPLNHQAYQIIMLGFNPDAKLFHFARQNVDFHVLRKPRTIIFDASSRSMYGPVADLVRQRGHLEVTAFRKRVDVVGLLKLGPGFGNDGYAFTSDSTFAELSGAGALPGVVAVRVKPRTSVPQAIANLRAALPNDVRFTPMREFLDQERNYWLKTSPIGFVFTAGLVLGIVVGAVVVYQILYSDVTNHLAEYATMKAMGYPDRALFRLVVIQAVLMSVLGFIPGALMAKAIFVVTHNATLLPLEITLERLSEVYALTLTMCIASGALAMLALKAADPAEIF